MKYKVRVGEEFDVEAVDLPDERIITAAADSSVKIFDAKTKRILVLCALAAFVVALAVATAIGMKSGSFSEVGTVWAVASPPLSYMLGNFFKLPNETK